MVSENEKSHFRVPEEFHLKNNKAKRSAKQERSDLVIVFLVQCSQGSVEQTHDHEKSYSAQLLTAAERCKNGGKVHW